jgi:fructose-1,6-bisphosphatase/inositol monophosphatase family enzyme
VREAGGYVTDMDGNSDGMFTKRHIVAGNETIQRALVVLLKAATTPPAASGE